MGGGGGGGRTRGLGSRCLTTRQGQEDSQHPAVPKGGGREARPSRSQCSASLKTRRPQSVTTAATRELTATGRLFVRRDGRSPADGAAGGDGARYLWEAARQGGAAGPGLWLARSWHRRRRRQHYGAWGYGAAPSAARAAHRNPGEARRGSGCRHRGKSILQVPLKSTSPGSLFQILMLVMPQSASVLEAVTQQHDSTYHPWMNSMGQMSGLIPASQDARAILCLGSAPCRVPSLQPGRAQCWERCPLQVRAGGSTARPSPGEHQEGTALSTRLG